MSKNLAKKLWIKTYLQENGKGLTTTASSRANEAVQDFNNKFKKKQKQQVSIHKS